jgi:hypothetical protein
MQAITFDLKSVKNKPYGIAGTVKQCKHRHRHMHTHTITYTHVHMDFVLLMCGSGGIGA